MITFGQTTVKSPSSSAFGGKIPVKQYTPVISPAIPQAQGSITTLPKLELGTITPIKSEYVGNIMKSMHTTTPPLEAPKNYNKTIIIAGVVLGAFMLMSFTGVLKKKRR